tara:strand:- start:32 stop:442 length:411 start_codon:yes stop_codon:yes gene_type:complete
MLNRSITRFALCLAAFLLGAFVALGGEPEIQQVDFHFLAPNAEIRLRTETQVIELKIIDPDQGAAVVRISRDGSEFGSPRSVILLGATLGRQQGALSLIEMGVIRKGLKLELGIGDLRSENRVHTKKLTSIELLKK